jgi:hypothetical protein
VFEAALVFMVLSLALSLVPARTTSDAEGEQRADSVRHAATHRVASRAELRRCEPLFDMMADTPMSTNMSTNQPKFDESRWPIVVVTPPTQLLEGAVFEKYLADVQKYYERGQAFGLVFDIRRSPPLNAAQRRRISEEIDRAARDFPSIRVVQGIVLASAVQRGIVSAITWLTKQPAPTAVFAEVDEAVAWAQKELRAPETNRRTG